MLDSLLYPESVAVIGASRTLGKIGHELLANLVNGVVCESCRDPLDQATTDIASTTALARRASA